MELTIEMQQKDFEGYSGSNSVRVDILSPKLSLLHSVDETNHDGRIELGENVELEMRVRNEGPIDAKEVVLQVDVPHPLIRLSESRPIGILPAGASSGIEKFAFVAKPGLGAVPLPVAVCIQQEDFPTCREEFTLPLFEPEPIVREVIAQDAPIFATHGAYGQGSSESASSIEPEIVLLSPEDAAIMDHSPIEIEWMVADRREIGEVGLVINDQPAARGLKAFPKAKTKVASSSSPGKVRVRFSQEIELREGANKVTILATNGDNRQARYEFDVTYDPGAVEIYDKMWAVIIGIDKYENPAYNLEYAAEDAKAVEQTLRASFRFDQIIALYDKSARRDDIEKVLLGDLRQSGPNDAVLVFFAGHGYTEKTRGGELGYIVPYDGSVDEPRKNISMTMIKEDISKSIPAKHILYVMDSCFGGLLLSTRGISSEMPNNDLAYVRSLAGKPARQVLTAGGADQEVLDKGPGGHSVFTGRLLEMLNEPGKAFITAQDIGYHIERLVNQDARERGQANPQRPMFGALSGEGSFVFLRK
jgi:hypothetical protein